MATGDVRIYDTGGHSNVPTWRWQTEAASDAIYAGDPVKLKAAGSPYVIPLATGEPVIGTTTQVIGIAAMAGTHTSAADGYVDVYRCMPGVVYACKATTSTNFDTQSEINALCGDRVAFDLTSTTFTVDENEGDDGTLGLQIIGGDPDTATVYFTLRPAAYEGPIA